MALLRKLLETRMAVVKGLVWMALLTAFALKAIHALPSAHRPVLLAVAMPVLVGYIVHTLTTFRERARNTALFYALLQDELDDNPRILERIIEQLASPFQESPPDTVTVNLPALRPYLPVWEMIAASSEKHYLGSDLVVGVSRLKRQFDYLSERLTEFADITWRYFDKWTTNRKSALRTQAGRVEQLAKDTLTSATGISKLVPAPWLRDVRSYSQLWPLVFVLAAFGLWLGAGATETDSGGALRQVVQAERFEVVDSAGRVRAAVGFLDWSALGGVIPDGVALADGPGIRLFDRTGRPRAALGLSDSDVVSGLDGQPALCLLDGNGTGRAHLEVNPEGAHLVLYDARGMTRAMMLEWGEGPALEFYDESGRESWHAP